MSDTITLQTGAENVVWDLTPFYGGIDDPAIEADMQKTLKLAEDFAARYHGHIGELDAAAMLAALHDYEAIFIATHTIGAFAQLTYSTDTNNPRYGALVQKVMEFSAQISQILVFFDLEWTLVDDARALAAMDDPILRRYRHALESERRYKPYRLSEKEEQLLVETDVTGSSAWTRLFTQIMSAMRFDFEGEPLTQSQVLAKLHEPNREARAKAADALTASLRNGSMELTYIFNVLAADKAADDRRRGFPTWISARNLSNKASDAVVESLVTSVTSRYDLVERYYNLKRALLGYDELYDYDRYAPLFDESDRTYSWDEAREIVQSAYHAFSMELGGIVDRAFDERWIHAALQPGKRGGAYSMQTVPRIHPYVLMNYTGNANDIMTLAHELGHSVHQHLATQAQPYLSAQSPLTTSETASTFGEMLVFQDLMAKEPDPARRLAMLARKIEDSFATVFRQISMNRFEDALHNGRRNEGELTAERISEMWMQTQKAMYGDSLKLRDDYGLWWSYIPHFLNTPGYVYAYAFGELLVLALFNLYRERGAAFVPQYLDVLAAGNSDYPEVILKTVGVDLADPAFWNEGLEAISALIDQAEQLAREVFPGKFKS